MAGRYRRASVLVLLVPLAACGGGAYSAASHAGSALQIESPKKGEKVSVPFTVRLSSDLPLGPPGRQHYVRVHYDGLKGPVVTDETFRVTRKQVEDPGPLTINVSLLTPDGKWTGSGGEVRVDVTKVAGGGAG